MNPKPRRYHLEIQCHRKNYYGLIRSSYRKDGKVLHSNHGRISGLPLEQLKLIQAAFRGDVIAKDSPEALRLLGSKEYGAIAALLALAKEIGLDRALYSRPSEPWVRDALAMIVGRLVYAGSKLSLSHQWKNTALWELCGVEGPVDVDQHCYAAMDRQAQRLADGIRAVLGSQRLDYAVVQLESIVDFKFRRGGPNRAVHEHVVGQARALVAGRAGGADRPHVGRSAQPEQTR